MEVSHFKTCKTIACWEGEMKQAIDLHNMQTAIHELFIVEHKPKTVLKAFSWLDSPPEDTTSEEYEDTAQYLFNTVINPNTDYLGEIHYSYIQGGHLCQNHIPVDDCIYADGESTYRIIGRFHF
jgi:hypothetical protein